MLTASALAWAVAPLMVQFAKVELTPPEPLPLGGYTARQGKLMDAGGEPLYARTLVLTQGGLRVAIVSLEMLTIPESLVQEVQAKVGAKTKLMLVASHTHCAPDSQMLNNRMVFAIPGIASFKSRWLDWYATRIAGSIKLALEADPVPSAKWSLAQSKVDANRARRPGAKPDQALTAIQADGQLRFVHYAAHATVLEDDHNLANGDWPGGVMAATGALVLPGAIGDVSPAASGQDSVEKLSKMVEKVVAAIPPNGYSDVKVSRRGLGYCQIEIRLPEPKPHPEFATANKVPEPLAQVLVKRFAPPSARVTAVRIGDVILIGIPGEPTSEIGAKVLTLARRRGFPHPLTISHVNGWVGYILQAPDYARGGYEATLAFHGPSMADRVMEAVERAIDQLR